jgi:hypothetical protein
MNKEKIWRIIFALIILGIGFIFMVSIHRIIKQTEKEKTQSLTEINKGTKGLIKESKREIDSLVVNEVKNVIQSEDLGGSSRSWQKYLVALGTGLLIGGASFCLGSFSGFLFGIPRIMNSSSAQSVLKSSKNIILHNDNLVQISDWLTKIIVGVGLTQINKAPEKLWQMGEKISYCFDPNGNNGNSNKDIATVISICVVLYFLILGFIAAYLWTRVYFSHMFEKEIELEEHANLKDSTSTNQ